MQNKCLIQLGGIKDPLGWVVTVGGFGEDSINALVPLSNNSVLAGGSFTSSILIGDDGHDSTQLGFEDVDGFIAISTRPMNGISASRSVALAWIP